MVFTNADDITMQAWIPQINGSKKILFGEALAFYELLGEQRQLLVICWPLEDLTNRLGALNGSWSSSIVVLDAKHITDKVAIWKMETVGSKIWILRKHPGLAMLGSEELRGIEEDDEDNANDSDEEVDE